MEKDLKVLEEFLNDLNLPTDELLKKHINLDEIEQAIENLMNRNKTLEKENQSLIKQYEYQGALITNEYLSKNEIKEWFIPKSILQELLEDVDKTPFINKHLKGKYLYDNLKFILQEGDETND